MGGEKPVQDFDVVVVGSGAGGVTAAITAARHGLRPVIIEKGALWGGSSGLSGGGMWIPNNPVSVAAGLQDSFEEALTYMDTVIGDVGPASSRERRVAFLKNGPEMVRFLQEEGVTFVPAMEYPDYYPDKPGGKIGRSIEATFFDLRKLGPLAATLRRSPVPIPFYSGEAHLLPKAFTEPVYFYKVIGLFLRGAWFRLTGRQMVGMGGALLAHLMYVAQRYQVPLWLNTPCRRLLVEGERVVGVEVLKDGQPLEVRSRAVILAAGGFDHNAEMRKQYHGIDGIWSVGNPDNTGDLILQCMELGADMALLDDAWWGAGTVDHQGQIGFILWERSMPHCIVVDQEGRRFTNESASYVDFGHDMLEQNRKTGGKAIPSWLIFDSQNRSRYIFGMAMPRFTPREFIEKGYFIKAGTLEELARRCGIPVDNLLATVARFNEMARNGVDEDFERGRTAYDNYYGDPTYRNPNLGTIERGPFYAVKVYPGDLGTKGGMLTDEYARVLKNGRPIPGLYATGNCSASVMGRTYPGPGATLGPAMTFAYIAAKHVAAEAGAAGSA
ncbi:MAG: FAD-dependent oxidoreductase [Thermaerobacter sp.]|nr:3-oxosteroid 1-dehydrogenase [Bacillota bacterium]